MLIGFLKNANDVDCKAQIIGYVDRIWVRESADIFCRRSFTVEVLQDSPVALAEITLLLTSPISEVKPENDTAFDLEWYFNSALLRSTDDYSIKSRPEDNQLYGEITDDGIDRIRVFTGKAQLPSVSRFNHCSLVTFKFPRPLLPGQRSQSRLSFLLPSRARYLHPMNPAEPLLLG